MNENEIARADLRTQEKETSPQTLGTLADDFSNVYGRLGTLLDQLRGAADKLSGSRPEDMGVPVDTAEPGNIIQVLKVRRDDLNARVTDCETQIQRILNAL